jgi:hypothetical protein
MKSITPFGFTLIGVAVIFFLANLTAAFITGSLFNLFVAMALGSVIVFIVASEFNW